MSIKHAILGFLSQAPQTGYDLKKLFVESDTLYWSGSNNQIYRNLLKLHEEGLVNREIEYQEDNPARKIYTITARGQEALREWLASEPELPELKNYFLIRLMWADQLDDVELLSLLAQYKVELEQRLAMVREQARRGSSLPPAGTRGRRLRQSIGENWIAFYEGQLAWVHALRRELEEE
jgi:DNA-binding PadR family transcriptional regulator